MSDDHSVNDDPAPRPNSAVWLDRGFLLAVLLACAVAVSPNLADPDLWGHVRYGLDVFEDGLSWDQLLQAQLEYKDMKYVASFPESVKSKAGETVKP